MGRCWFVGHAYLKDMKEVVPLDAHLECRACGHKAEGYAATLGIYGWFGMNGKLDRFVKFLLLVLGAVPVAVGAILVHRYLT